MAVSGAQHAPRPSRGGTSTRLLAACALAALTGAACTFGGDSRPRLAMASVRQPATALVFLAQASGCFDAEPLRVEERTFELGRDALALLRAGGVDVAVAYETPLLRAALEDDRLRVLTRLHTSTRNTRLVVRGAAGIRTFADLRGARIALARGTNAEFFADLVLGLGAVPHGTTRLVDLQPPQSVAALSRGEVDAAVLSDPFAAEAEQALGGAGRTLLGDLYVESSLLITRADVVAARAPALRALLRGLACAERRAEEDPQGARALIRPRFGELSEPALAAQLARVRWGLGLDNVLLDVLRRERDWLLSAGPAGGSTLRLVQLIDPRLLDEVEPESVMLLPGAGAPRW